MRAMNTKLKTFALLLTVMMSAALTGCTTAVNGVNDAAEADANTASPAEPVSMQQQREADSGKVELTVWGAAEDEELLQQILEEFQETYKDQADFTITFSPQSESECKDALMSDLEGGADVFAFADDQLNTLVAAGALEAIENAEAVRAANIEGAVEAASVDGTLYAWPLTADNGYFLYYNTQYISPEDARTLDGILEAAAANDKKMVMDWSSGWYTYAFFGNTGLTVGLNDDGITNYCTWNGAGSQADGIDVARAMLDIAAHPGFLNGDDGAFLSGVQNGTAVAGISGVWNAVAIQSAWGSHYAAAKLPTYTCDGKQIQMASFSGYKLIGVNAYSPHYAWSCLLAEWISNEANQQRRFEMRGQGPANRNAAASASVQDSPAITALIDQSEYSFLQRVGGNFWDPVSAFSANMAAGNPEGGNLQEQLDAMVEGIVSP